MRSAIARILTEDLDMILPKTTPRTGPETVEILDIPIFLDFEGLVGLRPGTGKSTKL